MNFRRWTLRTKVILHVLVLGVLSAVIISGLYIATQRRILIDLSVQKADLLGSLIKSSVFMLKKCGRIEDTQAKIHELGATTSAIRRIRILTNDGRIFASTAPEESGQTVPPETRKMAAEMLAKRTPRRSLFLRREHTIRSLILVENRPECYACHTREPAFNGLLEVHLDYGETAAVIRKSQWKGVILAVAALVILTFIILRLFERLINRPITTLKNEMKRVQEGDLSVRLQPLKDDEIGNLTKSFNGMVENLRLANQKIEDLYRERIDKAEHLAVFGELTAGLAHELKNPLSGIKGALEIINQSTSAADPRKDIFQEILFQTDKLINVIQDFLDYARPKPFRFSLISPNIFVDTAVKLAKTQLQGKEIVFDFHGLPEDAVAYLDADKMQAVMLNLMLNSVAAIADAGRIGIDLSLGPEGSLDIRVSDNGRGIKEAQLGQIFHPFFSTKKNGTGLGLSICRKIIAAHGGVISVLSREGVGTTFLIRVPLRRPAA
jgi:signal transduction histidine kinase